MTIEEIMNIVKKPFEDNEKEISIRASKLCELLPILAERISDTEMRMNRSRSILIDEKFNQIKNMPAELSKEYLKSVCPEETKNYRLSKELYDTAKRQLDWCSTRINWF